MQLFKRGFLTRCVSLLLSEYNYLERSTTYDNADLAGNEISSPLLLADGAAAPAPSSQEAITLDTLGPTPHPCPSPSPTTRAMDGDSNNKEEQPHLPLKTPTWPDDSDPHNHDTDLTGREISLVWFWGKPSHLIFFYTVFQQALLTLPIPRSFATMVSPYEKVFFLERVYSYGMYLSNSKILYLEGCILFCPKIFL